MKNITLLKQTVALGFIGSTVLLSPFATQALTVEEVTNPRQDNGGWVTDMADILSDRTEAELNNLITNLEQNNDAEIAVVTVPEITSADSPKAFATQLFNYWGIGKAESDNGVLFLVSMEDKRVEIETGYGIESTLSDTEVAKIIDAKITPQYKHENFDRGTLDGTKALISTLQTSANNQNSSRLISQTGNQIKATLPDMQTTSFIILLLFILFLWWIIDTTMAANNGGKTSRRKRTRSSSSSQNHYTGCNSGSSSSSGGGFGGGSSDGDGGGGDF